MDIIKLIPEIFKNNWLTMISLLIALFTLLKTQKWKRALSIQLGLLIDDSHSFVSLIESHLKNKCIIERTNNLNHKITHLSSIIPSFARKWVSVNKPQAEWPIWEQKLLISMSKYRLKNQVLKLLRLR